MLIVGDHNNHSKDYKYKFYPSENSKAVNSTKKKLERLCLKKMNYTIWLRSLNKKRISYLKEIGIKDFKKLITLSKMSFHHLPYDVRYKLQTIPI